MNNQSSNYQYTYKTEDIPLGKVDTFDDEQKSYYNNNNKRGSVYQVQQSKFSLLVQPLFSVILAIFFSIALLLLFLHADGKPLNYTIIGMKIPSLVSLLLSISVIFVASGISKAVAEFKWVKLQQGAPLTMIDIYDACTRGLSGFFLTIRAFQFDLILIIALLFHVGLLVVSPASQAILVPVQRSYNTSGAATRFYNYKPSDTQGRTKLGATGQPPMLNGLNKNSYLTASSFAQASVGSVAIPNFSCPNDAAYCLYKNISFVSTSISCQPLTENDKALVYHNNTNNIVVLKEYFTTENVTLGSTVGSFPKFLYSTDMINRTSYDLDNYKQPMWPGLNVTMILASDKEYDPQYRPYVGEQSFVMAYNTLLPSSSHARNYTELSFKKCLFNSSLNTTDWKTANGTLVKDGTETSQPITLDFDNVLGNNVALSLDALGKNYMNSVMVNAYTMQQAIMMELIRPKSYFMYEYLGSFGVIDNTNYTSLAAYSAADKFERFMKQALTAFDYAYFQSPYLGGKNGSSLNWYPTQGVAVFSLMPEYHVDKAFAYALCLSLILPILWWVILWFYSLKKNNGVARSSSQIVLLATNMTSQAEQSLRGLSNLDSSNAFNRAKTIRVRLGQVNQQTMVGLEHETDVRPFT